MTCIRRCAPREVHVYLDTTSCRWIVATGGRALSRHRTQHAAIVRGIRAATRRRADLVTHNRHGRFRSKDTYGQESPRRDTER